MSGENRESGIKVLHKAVDVLRQLSNTPSGMSLSELSQSVNFPRSTVQRIVATLESELLVEQTGKGGGYRMGPGLGLLLQNTQSDLVASTRPFLRNLSSEVRESVSLATLYGDKLHVADCIIYERDLRVSFPVGLEAPCYATAAGQVLMSTLPDELIEKYIPENIIVARGSKVTRDSLIQQIKKIRETGIGIDEQDHIEGVCTFSAALKTNFGKFSITILSPAIRAKYDQDFYIEKLTAAKIDIEDRLNFFS
ncbi:IclR family transcriptional regulator [Serratia sp. M24T3]|uniref:IclR family transcriptional regulator n=1 Tax=Rouxiella sp. WC2420 TaxID=3234145 RepID=A0AB39VUH5_9GAMM|nr:IclR family transcriptional regulator [Serratia sp. M24T3]EIC86237.1 HTH-type transcriptional regulator TtgV [Serratia sp. M24T3]